MVTRNMTSKTFVCATPAKNKCTRKNITLAKQLRHWGAEVVTISWLPPKVQLFGWDGTTVLRACGTAPYVEVRKHTLSLRPGPLREADAVVVNFFFCMFPLLRSMLPLLSAFPLLIRFPLLSMFPLLNSKRGESRPRF